jgi:hypothetical protein
MEQDSVLQTSARSQAKTEVVAITSQLKLEVKRLKDDIERVKKSHVDKVKQL